MRRTRTLSFAIGLFALWLGAIRFCLLHLEETYALQLLVILAIPIMWIVYCGPLLLWQRLTRPAPPPLYEPEPESYPEPPAWLTVGRHVRLPNGIKCRVTHRFRSDVSPVALLEIIGEKQDQYRIEPGGGVLREINHLQGVKQGWNLEWTGWGVEELEPLD